MTVPAYDSKILTLIDQALASSDWYPRLPPALLMPYVQDRDRPRRKFNRIMMTGGMIAWNLYWIAIYFVTPDIAQMAAITHFLYGTPLFTLFLVLDLKHKVPRRAYDWSVLYIALQAPLLATIEIFTSTSPGALLSVRLLPILLLVTGLLWRMAPKYTVINAVVTTLLSAAVVFFSGKAPLIEWAPLLISQFVVAASVIGFCVQREANERRVFLLHTADAIHRAKLTRQNEKLKQQAKTDTLTGLNNRRYFDHALDRHWRHAIGAGDPIALIMIDIDHFKLFNDAAGHKGGDLCLRQVAQAMRAAIRDHDVIARFGGEEFAVIMPGASLHAAMQGAERLRMALVHMALHHPGLGHDGRVSISLGVSVTRPVAGSDAVASLHEADLALYDAKKGGRNCVRVSVDGVLQPTPRVGKNGGPELTVIAGRDVPLRSISS